MGSGESKNTWTEKSCSMTRQIKEFNYPDPSPPTKTKQDLFDKRECGEIDAHVLQVPEDVLYGTYEDIATYLIRPCTSDLQKVRAIFVWTVSLDVRSLQSSLHTLPDPDTPLDFLLQMSAHWQAEFFTQMCRAVKIPCIIVDGVKKNSNYKLAGKVDRSTMSAQWNSVYLNGEWHLLDLFWALLYVDSTNSNQKFNEAYFLTNPEELLFTHLPDEKHWQLVPHPISFTEFENRVYIRERFFEMGMMVDAKKSVPHCVAKAKDGMVNIFFATERFAPEEQFQYILQNVVFPSKAQSKIPLDRYVFFHKSPEGVYYRIQMPLKGRFRLDIYGMIENTHDTFDLCASYILDCKQPANGAQPLPDAPDIGWGPSTELHQLGLVPLTHEFPMINTDDGALEIRFRMNQPLVYLKDINCNDVDDWLLRNNVCISTEGDDLVVHLRLQYQGDYGLYLFAAKAGFRGELPNVCNYLVMCSVDNAYIQPYPNLHEGILGKSLMTNNMDVNAITEMGGFVSTENSHNVFEFGHNDNHEVLCELDNNQFPREFLATCVSVSEGGSDKSVITISLPSPGEYALNVYTRTLDDPIRLYHVHSYLLTSSQAEEKYPDDLENRQNLPFVPISTTKVKTVIRMPRSPNKLLAELQKMNAVDELRKGQVLIEQSEEQSLCTLMLHDDSDYRLEIFELKDSGALDNKCTYYIVKQLADEEEDDDGEEEIGDGNEEVEQELMESDIEDKSGENVEVRTNHAMSWDDVAVVSTSADNMQEEKASQDIVYNQHPSRNVEGSNTSTDEASDSTKQEPVNGESVVANNLNRWANLPTNTQVYRPASRRASMTPSLTGKTQGITQEDLAAANAKAAQMTAARKAAAAEAAQKKEMYDQLKASMKSQDAAQMRDAISAFEKAGYKDDEDQLSKAKEQLTYLEYSNDIKDAMDSRNLSEIDDVIRKVETGGYEKKLGIQFQMAKKVAEQLRRIEKLRHEVLNLDQKCVAEIKSYSKPPDGILQVMQATFLLLGNTESEVKEWPAVVVLIGKTGKEGLKRRINEFDVQKVKRETTLKAKSKIAAFDLASLRDVSVGAATFYVWASGMVEECQSRFQQTKKVNVENHTENADPPEDIESQTY